MTNEEKAKELANRYSISELPVSPISCIEESCLKMAEWKEQQLSEIIKRANNNSTHQYELGYTKGVEETKEKMIEKGTEWLKDNAAYYHFDMFSVECPEDLLDDFKQAMEK